MGSNDTKSTSAPLTADQRAATYNAGMQSMGGTPSYQYQRPKYERPQTERLTADYDGLQRDLTSGYTAALDYAKERDTRDVDSSLASRGVWSSGLSQQAINDVNSSYAPQYARAGADATNARYGLQTADIQGNNANNINVAAGQNEANASAADKEYESKWRPADYKAGVWNGTGGVVSSSNTSGWSI
jgi:hypothetical protein